MERAVGHRVDGFNARFPRAVFAGFVVEGDFDFAIETIVEQFPVLIAGLYLLAADRDQVIANFYLDPIFVGWTIFVNIADAITSCSFVRLQIDAEISGRDATRSATTRSRRGASVRSIQFANHLVNDVQQFLTIADVFHQWFVLRFRGIPIHSMHGRIVEAILHRAPGVAEHLSPFGRAIDLHAHIESNATACSFTTACCTSTSGRCCCCRCGARRQRH